MPAFPAASFHLQTPIIAPDAHVVAITQVIQLSIAPVFLLTAVGTFIAVLSNRLGRAVDRIRFLESHLRDLAAEDLQDAHRELRLLGRRMRLIYISIGLAVLCAIFVALLIALAFIDAFLAADLSRLIGLLFIAAMVAFIGSLMVFLREVFLAITNTRLALGKDDVESGNP